MRASPTKKLKERRKKKLPSVSEGGLPKTKKREAAAGPGPRDPQKKKTTVLPIREKRKRGTNRGRKEDAAESKREPMGREEKEAANHRQGAHGLMLAKE